MFDEKFEVRNEELEAGKGEVSPSLQSRGLFRYPLDGGTVQAQPSPRLAHNSPREFCTASGSLPAPKTKVVSFSLLLKFMILLSFAVFSVSFLFVAFLRLSVTSKQDSELEKAAGVIIENLSALGIEEVDFLELPYFITYTIFEKDSKKVLATNDSLLPLLEGGERSSTYFARNFFTDGDLKLRYLTKKMDFEGKTLCIEVAIDIANDSASKMISALPYLAVLSFIPILLISFLLSFLISRSTITAFKKLQSDYDREKAFTGNVSHELKTPISIIDGHANLLKRWGKDDPKQLSESIDAILHETENMNSIVTTLLDMSRIENGKLKIETKRFFVTNFFASLKEEFCITHPDCRILIEDPDFLEIETDENKLHQIFTVILSNSVKFAGKDCKILLKAHKAGGKIELSASDNGKGFTKEDLPHIFERFYKGDKSHDRNVSGAGLGLSIAKTLTEALGGRIEAENESSGGAKVKILLGA